MHGLFSNYSYAQSLRRSVCCCDQMELALSQIHCKNAQSRPAQAAAAGPSHVGVCDSTEQHQHTIVEAVRNRIQPRTSYLCSAKNAACMRCSLLLCCPKQQQIFSRMPLLQALLAKFCSNSAVPAMHITIVNIDTVQGSWMITHLVVVELSPR